jgi:hypothetical protein
MFFKDVACLMCKASLPLVIYTSHTTRSFESFDERELVASEKLGGSLTHEPLTRSTLERLLEFVCPLCGPVTGSFPDRDALSAHVTRQHNLNYCPVCLRDRPVFVSEQVCFGSKTEMTAHMNKGDDKTHMKGHPKCHFCNEHFYGDEQLYEHMKQLHMECPVCRSRGVLHQFYRAYRDLRKHWNDSAVDHFVCPDTANCEMAVFGTDVDWRQHQLNVHGSSLSKQEARRLLNVTDVFEIRLSGDRRTANDRSGRIGFQTAESENEAATSSPPPTTSSSQLALAVQALPQPPSSEAEARGRNADVMARMREILDEEVFVHFRENAQRFRDGQISPQDYFDAFVGIFGEAEAATLFPKVVSILPAAEKRAVLFDIYTRYFVGRKPAVPAPAASSSSPSPSSSSSTATSSSTSSSSAAGNQSKNPKDKNKDGKKKASSMSAPPKPRKCSSCRKERPVSEFSKNQLKRGAGESKCKACLGEGVDSETNAHVVAAPVVSNVAAVASNVVVVPSSFPSSSSSSFVAPPPGFGPPPGFERHFPALPGSELRVVLAEEPAKQTAGNDGKKKKKQQQKKVLLKFG